MKIESYKKVTFYEVDGTTTMCIDCTLYNRYKDLTLIDVTVEYQGRFVNIHGFEVTDHYHCPDDRWSWDIETNIEEYCVKESDWEPCTTMFSKKIKKKLKEKYYRKKKFNEHFLSYMNLNIRRTNED